MKTKIKTPVPVISTREEMGQIAGEIAALENKRNALTTAMNEALDAVRKQHAPEIERVTDELSLKTKAALDWCVRNEPEEFKRSRTIDFTRAEVLFKRGNFEVSYRSGWKVEDIIKALKAFLRPGKPPGTNYVRTVEEVNKEAIIQDRKELTDDEWLALGIKVTQGKSVIITGKGEPVQNATREAA